MHLQAGLLQEGFGIGITQFFKAGAIPRCGGDAQRRGVEDGLRRRHNLGLRGLQRGLGGMEQQDQAEAEDNPQPSFPRSQHVILFNAHLAMPV
ncbi:hypothetical protein [Candidatus Venteria ishoeyi]|uniref:hypothetical protein n=1 Tax=Candidatus Venteria ishoeyi TaxID=1899563 RepID=UPI000CDED70E|nr:hypothetical protein [Candidatus Venteria ishoeyi]